MDSKVSAPTELDEVLAQWEQDKENNSTLGHGYESILSNGSSDTITLSHLGGYNNTMLGGVYSNSGPYTISTSVPANAMWSNGTGSGRITLNGENADVEVNGWSLVDAIKRIEERLNLLRPNPKLEEEWDQLRELGDQYRALEKKLKEQTEMWNRLKSMPPPDPLT